MFQIRDWLYISSYPVASNEQLVRAQNINVMLQLFKRITMRGITGLYLDVMDGKPIAPALIQQGVEFVTMQHHLQKRILITCGAGVSRSVTFSVAALKEIEGLSLEEAYLSIRKKHKEALPDHIHWDSLREYYNEGPEFWHIWETLILDEEDLA